MSIQSDEYPKASYPLDAENAEEMNRLVRHARLITDITGLFPLGVHPTKGQTIVDLACGPGEWALKVAQKHPGCQVIGVDISDHLIAYARAQAQWQGVSNIRFEVGDVCKPLAFADESVDLIHARFLVSFLSTTDWPRLLAECFRILRPGGLMCSTEFEGDWGITSSPALTRLNNLIVRLFHLRHQCFIETGERVGITVMQAYLLQASGFVSLAQTMHTLSYSAGTSAHPIMLENLAAFVQLIGPSLMQHKLIEQEEVSLLYAQIMRDMYLETFSGMGLFQTVLGEKPVGTAPSRELNRGE